MTNKIKLVITTVLMAVLALTLSLFTINLKSANAADSNYSGSGTFEMVNTVKLRLDDDGFAFKAKMDADTYESVVENENKKIMFIIVPYTFKATIGSGAWVDGGTTHYWGLIRRYASDGEGYSKGDFNATASYCVYVEATAYYDSVQEVYFLQAGIGNILAKNRSLDYFAVAVIEERVYDGETLTGFNYTYANVPSGKTAMPETNICDVVTSAFYGDTKYINVINDVYSWFGTEDYPVPVNDADDYACLQNLYDSEEYGDYVKGLYYNIDSEIETDDDNYPLDNATTTYQVTFNVNNEDYGTTTETSFRVAEGTEISVNGVNITIGNTVITALPSEDTVQYHYYFENFTVGEDALPETVTENITITANFDWSLKEYTVSLEIGQDGYGSLSTTSVVNVPYGTVITASDNTVTINGTTVTATPTTPDAQYSYAFDSWTNGTATVTGNTTVTANFTQTLNTYTVSVEIADGQSGYGSLSTTSVADVPYGTTLIVFNNSVTINGTTVTATPTTPDAQYSYAFNNWTNGDVTVEGNTTVTANFTRTTRTYTVTINRNNTGYGTVTKSSVANVPYGTVITTSDNTVTINGTTVTATPSSQTAQYSYAFGSWTNGTATVTGATTVTANFTRTTRTYTVTINTDNTGYGTVDITSVANVPYNTVITASGNTVTINGTKVTATPKTQTAQYSYAFGSWTNGTATVTGATTVTANFTRTTRSYTISGTVDGTAAGLAWNAITATASNNATVTMSRNANNIANYSVTATYGTNLTITFSHTNANFYPVSDTFTVTGAATKNYTLDDPVLTIYNNKLSHTGYKQFTSTKMIGDYYYGSHNKAISGKYYYMEYNVVMTDIVDPRTGYWSVDFGLGFFVGGAVGDNAVMVSRVNNNWVFEIRNHTVWQCRQAALANNVSTALTNAIGINGTAVKLSLARAGDFIAMFVNDTYVGSVFTYEFLGGTLETNGNGSIGIYSRTGIACTYTDVNYSTDQTTINNKVSSYYNSYATGTATKQANNMIAWGSYFKLTNSSGNVTAENTACNSTTKITFSPTQGGMETAVVQYNGLSTSNYYLEANVSSITAKNDWGGCQVGFNVFGGAQTVFVLVEKVSNTQGYCVRVFAPDWSVNQQYTISSGTTAYTTVANAFTSGSMLMGLRRVNNKCYVYVNGVLVKSLTFPAGINASAISAAGFGYRGTSCVIQDMRLYTL